MQISGKKGGKGGGHTHYEAPNNLKSVSTAKVIDLISEGEIHGLVNSAQSIYLDDIQLQNEDGSFNFEGVSVEFRNGLPDQTYLPGFSQVESFTQVGREVKHNLPVSSSFTDPNVDAVVVTMEFPNLSKNDTENGDVLQYSVQFRIRIRADEGLWNDFGIITVAGKCISSFQRSYYFKLPQSQDGRYVIEVIRVSEDDNESSKNSRINWAGYSKIIESKLSYPNRAVCGVTVRADQFGSNVPSRKYEVYGLKVQVPSNYDAWNHTYTSEIWDGTFKLSWTNNPAWIFYDLLTNARYGLGRELRPEFIDKYGLYLIGRYCDEKVSDGKGGLEPRFTFNGTISNRESAYSILNNLAGLFNSMIYYSGSTITLVQDSPKTPVRDFTPANVIDGMFNYEGVARSARHSVFQVTYSDPNDLFNSAVEVIENPDMIHDTGWKSSEITLLGCSSRAQARRRALRDAYTEQHETETVTFSVGIENADLVPGDIIRIADPSIAGARYGGRIVAVDKASKKITLDAETDFSIDSEWMLGFLLPDNTWMETPIYAEGISNEVTLITAPKDYPQPGTVWTAQCMNVEPRLFRVLSIKEDKPWQYSITALLHYNQKYDIIENGADFVDGAFSITPSGKLTAPNEVTAKQYMHRVGDASQISILVSWNPQDPRAINYMVQYKVNDDAVWTEAGYTSSESIVIPNTNQAKYTIQVYAIDAMGRRSTYSEIVYNAPGYNVQVSNVPELRAKVSSALGVTWEWDAVPDFDLQNYVLKVSNEHGEIKTTSLKYLSSPFNILGTLSASVVAENLGGNRSENPARNEVEILAPNAPSIRSAKVLDNGIHVDLIPNPGTWDTSLHELTFCESVNDVHLLQKTSGVFPVPTTWSPNAVVTARTKDIFNNWGASCENFVMTCYYPKTPKIELGYNPLTGNVTIDWQDCRNDVVGAPTISHYEVTGTLTDNRRVSVAGTHYEAVVPLVVYEGRTENGSDGIAVKVGAIYVSVSAVDKYGVSSKDAPGYKDNSVKLDIYPPYNPTDFGTSATRPDDELNIDANWTDGGAIVLTWKDCKRTFNISHYEVYDSYTKTTYKVSTNYVVLPVRREGTYKVWVTAYDVLGQSSATMQYNLRVGGVGGLTVSAKVDGSDILLEWNTPSASFAIDHYIIMSDNDHLPNGTNADMNLDGFLGTAKANYFRIPAGIAGTHTYYVWAVDAAGNVNSKFANYATVKVNAPLSPNKFKAEVVGNGVTLSWEPASGEGTLPIVSYEIRRYNGEVDGSNITNYREVANYGWLDGTSIEVPAFKVGNYTFAICAKDSGGNIGAWAFYNSFTVVAPGAVTITDPVIIDNNIHLYWRAPSKIFFPIKEYIVSEVQDEYEMEIGRADALYFSESEESAGTYTYRITPVDIAGNIGEPVDRVCRVAQPPDFIFYDKVDSQFGGGNAKPSGTNGRTNFVLDGVGHMLGPIVVNETWEANIARATTASGKTISTHQQKIDAGFTTWLEPYLASATYIETTNHGTGVPSCNLKVTITSKTIKKDSTVAGSPIFKCKIEVGKLESDGKTINWTVANPDGFSAYVSDFQYSRVTITVTHGYVEISNILIDLNIKKLTDFGRHPIKADDFATTQGTFIPFAVNFTAVQSLPIPRVVGYPDYTAHVNFDGSQINPKGFYVYVMDKDGNPKTAEVEWVAYGV